MTPALEPLVRQRPQSIRGRGITLESRGPITLFRALYRSAPIIKKSKSHYLILITLIDYYLKTKIYVKDKEFYYRKISKNDDSKS